MKKNNRFFSRRGAKTQRAQSLFFCIIPVILATVLLSGCGRGNRSDAAAASTVPVFAVNTTLAVQGPIQDYINFSGDIIAGSTVDVFSDAAGRITELHTSIGRRVNRGDPVAAVDSSRPGMTFVPGIATAPISGTIVAMPAQVGMMVTQAVPLARIAGGGGLEIRLHVAERFISRIAMNQPCEITLDAWPGEVFFGSISEMSPTVDLASRTMEVRVNVYDSRDRLKPGMFAKVKVITERKENIVKIPAAGVINRFGEQYVYIIEQDEEDPEITIVRKRIITPGILIDGVLEIQSGLTPNEEIVIRGQTLLDDGSRVNIIERMTPLGAN